jgi:hypothetical protein
MGLFACRLIKKHQSWPGGVPGDAMQAGFNRPGVNVGDVDTISRTQDGMPYFLWGMKEPNYVIHMMQAKYSRRVMQDNVLYLEAW